MRINRGRRLGACVIDWYLSAALASIPVVFIDLGFERAWETAIVSGCLAILLCCLYYLVIPLVWRGQTPGKRLMKIWIVGTDGSPVTFNMLLKREILGVLLIEGSIVASSSYLRELLQLCVDVPVWIPLSAISGVVTAISAGMAVWSKDGRMIHDWVGKTVVRNR